MEQETINELIQTKAMTKGGREKLELLWLNPDSNNDTFIDSVEVGKLLSQMGLPPTFNWRAYDGDGDGMLSQKDVFAKIQSETEGEFEDDFEYPKADMLEVTKADDGYLDASLVDKTTSTASQSCAKDDSVVAKICRRREDERDRDERYFTLDDFRWGKGCRRRRAAVGWQSDTKEREVNNMKLKPCDARRRFHASKGATDMCSVSSVWEDNRPSGCHSNREFIGVDIPLWNCKTVCEGWPGTGNKKCQGVWGALDTSSCRRRANPLGDNSFRPDGSCYLCLGSSYDSATSKDDMGPNTGYKLYWMKEFVKPGGFQLGRWTTISSTGRCWGNLRDCSGTQCQPYAMYESNEDLWTCAHECLRCVRGAPGVKDHCQDSSCAAMDYDENSSPKCRHYPVACCDSKYKDECNPPTDGGRSWKLWRN
eukprot:gnl/MRDRNA2_/MRDRNA2_65962_c0_seq1.p1 gnl/MRDRNA2_/MRDRNA2_65962_c0~~gnl/MRDRNA2_/MRDRNA2_65962_c0_seq1.p1  ORF type:complete len:423 (-),score=51.85 gnl/MRDRNA2_/MRDRNA2_65962_c0_seq1:114-1382(-)